MEKLQKLLMLLVITILSTTFTSCGGDDDNDEPNQNELLGKWELISSQDDDYWEKPCIFNFKENGLLMITFAQDKSNEEVVACRYELSGSKLVIDFGFGDEIYEGTYNINKDVLTFDMISYDPDDTSDVYSDFLTFKRI